MAIRDIGLSRLPLIVKTNGIDNGEAAAAEVAKKLRDEYGDTFTRADLGQLTTIRDKYFADADPQTVGARKLLDVLVATMQSNPAPVNNSSVTQKLDKGEFAAAVGRRSEPAYDPCANGVNIDSFKAHGDLGATEKNNRDALYAGRSPAEPLDEPALVNGLGLGIVTAEKLGWDGFGTGELRGGELTVKAEPSAIEIRLVPSTKNAAIKGTALKMKLCAGAGSRPTTIELGKDYRCVLDRDLISGPYISFTVQDGRDVAFAENHFWAIDRSTYGTFCVNELQVNSQKEAEKLDLTFKLFDRYGETLLNMRLVFDRNTLASAG